MWLSVYVDCICFSTKKNVVELCVSVQCGLCQPYTESKWDKNKKTKEVGIYVDENLKKVMFQLMLNTLYVNTLTSNGWQTLTN